MVKDQASQLDGCGDVGVRVGSASICGDVADRRLHAGERGLAGVREGDDAAADVEVDQRAGLEHADG